MVNKSIYHMSISHECIGVNACTFYCKSRENLYPLQVIRESVSGIASHTRCVQTFNEIEGLYYKIIITIDQAIHSLIIAVGIVTRAAHS